MTFIVDNIIILNQHNSFIYEKSHFKTSATVFLILKDKQYIFKTDAIDSINFTTASSVEKSIKMFVNIFLNDDLTMMISDFVIHKLLKFK